MQKVMFLRALQTQPWCNSSNWLAYCIDSGMLKSVDSTLSIGYLFMCVFRTDNSFKVQLLV